MPNSGGVVHELYTKHVEGKVQWSQVVVFSVDLMRVIETEYPRKGGEKLQLLQSVLRYALSKTDLNEVKRDEILVMINYGIPILAQAACLASKSPVVAVVKKKCAWWCCGVK